MAGVEDLVDLVVAERVEEAQAAQRVAALAPAQVDVGLLQPLEDAQQVVAQFAPALVAVAHLLRQQTVDQGGQLARQIRPLALDQRHRRVADGGEQVQQVGAGVGRFTR